MSVASLVASGLPVIAHWESADSGGSFAVAANGEHVIHDLPFDAVAGHAYLLDFSGTGFMNTAVASRSKYSLAVGATVVAAQDIGFHSGGWVGLMSVPIALTGVYVATATGRATCSLKFWTQAAWNDWVLDAVKHVLTVTDLGPQ